MNHCSLNILLVIPKIPKDCYFSSGLLSSRYSLLEAIIHFCNTIASCFCFKRRVLPILQPNLPFPPIIISHLHYIKIPCGPYTPCLKLYGMPQSFQTWTNCIIIWALIQRLVSPVSFLKDGHEQRHPQITTII